MSDKTPIKRKVAIRDVDDERTVVTWSPGGEFGTLMRIWDYSGGGRERVLAADTNELPRLLDTLKQTQNALSDSDVTSGRELVRDITVERVSVEWEDDFASLTVEALGETERMLILTETELAELIDAVEQANDELPSVDMGAYVN